MGEHVAGRAGGAFDDSTAGPTPAPVGRGDVPATGDPEVDAALRTLADTAENDLDGQLESGERLQRMLRNRLTDLGS